MGQMLVDLLTIILLGLCGFIWWLTSRIKKGNRLRIGLEEGGDFDDKFTRVESIDTNNFI